MEDWETELLIGAGDMIYDVLRKEELSPGARMHLEKVMDIMQELLPVWDDETSDGIG